MQIQEMKTKLREAETVLSRAQADYAAANQSMEQLRGELVRLGFKPDEDLTPQLDQLRATVDVAVASVESEAQALVEKVGA